MYARSTAVLLCVRSDVVATHMLRRREVGWPFHLITKNTKHTKHTKGTKDTKGTKTPDIRDLRGLRGLRGFRGSYPTRADSRAAVGSSTDSGSVSSGRWRSHQRRAAS